MDENLEKRVKIRRLKKSFVVEENLDYVQWPQECVVCGAIPAVKDLIRMEKKFKNFGNVKTALKDIPYCASCFSKVKATRRLDKAVSILALVFGIPLGLFLSYLMAKQPGTRLICLGLLLGVGIFIAWVIFYLLIRFPIRSIFKNRYTDYVDASLIEETREDKKEALSVVITIPRNEYAEKFASLNEVPPGGQP